MHTVEYYEYCVWGYKSKLVLTRLAHVSTSPPLTRINE